MKLSLTAALFASVVVVATGNAHAARANPYVEKCQVCPGTRPVMGTLRQEKHWGRMRSILPLWSRNPMPTFLRLLRKAKERCLLLPENCPQLR